MPSGKVLIAGGKGNSIAVLASAELYDPSSGSHSPTANLTTGRTRQSATLLNSGKVLIAGGDNIPNSPGRLTSAELFDEGSGFPNTARPVLSSAPASAVVGTTVTLGGSNLLGYGEASGGGTNNSATSYPLLQLRRQDNEQISFVPLSDGSGKWQQTSTTLQATLPSTLLAGPYLLTLITSGIPSQSVSMVVVAVAASPQGTACTGNDSCASGFCVDGVCCNTACGGGATNDCQACSVAAGASVSGTCAPRSDATTCSASGGTVCSSGSCVAGCFVSGAFVASGTANPTNACQTCQPAVSTTAYSNADGLACNDGNACSSSDVCASGVCSGTSYSCSAAECQQASCDGNGGCTVTNKASTVSCTADSNPCTADLCDGAGSCGHAVLSDGTRCGAGMSCSSGTCGANSSSGDLGSDFSTAANPNRAWAYGWEPTLGGTFGNDTYTGDFIAGVDEYSSPIQYLAIWHNRTSSAIVDGPLTFQPGKVVLHPGPSGQYSVVRWTAPASDSYAVNAVFSGVDSTPTTTDVHVLHNNSGLFDAELNLGMGLNTAQYRTMVALSAGDSLDFLVGNGGNDYNDDATQLDLTIVSTSAGG